mmetsp:Transcript_25595/g.80124  ORF Transcript_25595/g.80124 Transcript_25595/m.80124 type:complete len:270 (-) Transcript_25595:83-892(-)|eukprot:CAMPEP_0118862592 /NCGR_PEP_ID=MMETSP1163-20130328/7740_1 /TAXON_ID=124430 /ORGANISM="Phaeomonas parva, Strain CCMP2877" /LENGTH=269 /DNA_ID=CAMNT_0006796509 /DNA_START=114 /DNA_END=923 /DNA_ORIENTATION=-
MPHKFDKDLDGLIGRLNLVHQAVGGQRDDTVAGANMDDFSRAKYDIGRCIRAMEDSLSKMAEEKENGEGGGIDRVRLNTYFRQSEMNANNIWRELDALQRRELSKRRSKVEAELTQRSADVADLRRELDLLHDKSSALLNPNYEVQRRKVPKMEDCELFRAPGAIDGPVNAAGYSAGMAAANSNMTAGHRQQLEKLKERADGLDREYLSQIQRGVDELDEMARRFGERVRERNHKITEIQETTDEVNERLENVNGRLGETLKKARAWYW